MNKNRFFDIKFFDGIPFIEISGLPYAVDDKGLITYELTQVLRERMEKTFPEP